MVSDALGGFLTGFFTQEVKDRDKEEERKRKIEQLVLQNTMQSEQYMKVLDKKFEQDDKKFTRQIELTKLDKKQKARDAVSNWATVAGVQLDSARQVQLENLVETNGPNVLFKLNPEALQQQVVPSSTQPTRTSGGASPSLFKTDIDKRDDKRQEEVLDTDLTEQNKIQFDTSNWNAAGENYIPGLDIPFYKSNNKFTAIVQNSRNKIYDFAGDMLYSTGEGQDEVKQQTIADSIVGATYSMAAPRRNQDREPYETREYIPELVNNWESTLETWKEKVSKLLPEDRPEEALRFLTENGGIDPETADIIATAMYAQSKGIPLYISKGNASIINPELIK